VIVMLDADCSFKTLDNSDIDIYWGAYIGTEDEILMAGNLRELMGNIEWMQAEAKARKGWVMDTYLPRKHDA
jgi:precorrin-6A synthase